jgi:hypothetical protein
MHKTPREIIHEMWPFPEPKQGPLWDHLQYAASGPNGITDEQRQTLRDLYAQAETVVIAHVPDGFVRLPREPRDADYLVRLNRELTDEEQLVWGMPPVLP